MYGDTRVMRRRADQLREQGVDVRAMADRLVGRSEAVAWSGRAADALRARIRDRAADLREAADAHDQAADSLVRHLGEVDQLKEQIAAIERKAAGLVEDARGRVAALAAHDDPAGVRRTPSRDDRALVDFVPPPSGHRDWLTVELPGL